MNVVLPTDRRKPGGFVLLGTHQCGDIEIKTHGFRPWEIPYELVFL